MDEFNGKILLVCKSKRKIKPIRFLLSKIIPNESKTLFKMPSVTQRKENHIVMRVPVKEIEDSDGNKHVIPEYFYCDCKAKLFKEEKIDCVHILAAKTFLYFGVQN